jgi:hypothetical protein
MGNRLIFRYHLDRANPDLGPLREPLLREGLPTRPTVGNRWGDAEG